MVVEVGDLIESVEAIVLTASPALWGAANTGLVRTATYRRTVVLNEFMLRCQDNHWKTTCELRDKAQILSAVGDLDPFIKLCNRTGRQASLNTPADAPPVLKFLPFHAIE